MSVSGDRVCAHIAWLWKRKCAKVQTAHITYMPMPLRAFFGAKVYCKGGFYRLPHLGQQLPSELPKQGFLGQ